MTIEEVKALCQDNTIKITEHVQRRMNQRSIRYSEIKEAIEAGYIIEDYPNAYPHPACLVLGQTLRHRALHICLGTDGNTLWIITAYEPDLSEWEDDLMTRKEVV